MNTEKSSVANAEFGMRSATIAPICPGGVGFESEWSDD